MHPMPATGLPSSETPSTPANRLAVRLTFLEGVRGLAALYVLVYHVLRFYKPLLAPEVMSKLGWLYHGRVAVAVFIALSGYCLMLSTVRRPDQRGLPLGTFIRRRATRILPPYYAALVMSVIAYIASPKLKAAIHGSIDPTWTAHFAPSNLLIHTFLVENIIVRWNAILDQPMWSVCTEWQIYFIFILILLPVWQRFGDGATILTGLILGACGILLLGGRPQDELYSAPWFIGIFAIGMAAASISFPASALRSRLHSSLPWGWIGSALAASNVLLLHFFAEDSNNAPWLDLLTGTAVGCLLIALVRPMRFATIVASLLSIPPLVWLGEFSYSLYLVHSPILMKIVPMYQALHMSPLKSFLLLLLSGVPFIVGVSYAFFRLFERPFMRRVPHEKPVAQISITPIETAELAAD